MTRRLARVLGASALLRSGPPTSAPLLDLQDPAFLRDPHPTFRRLREFGPVVPLTGGGWAALSHQAVRTALGDPERFAVTRMFDSVLSGADGPVHARSRRAAASLLGPLDVRRAVYRAADALRARLGDRAGQPLDVVTGLADPLAIELGAELVGVPRAQLHRVVAAHHAGELLTELDRLCASCPPPTTLLDRLDGDLRVAREIHRTLIAASLTTTRLMLPVAVLLLLRDAEVEQQVRTGDTQRRALINEALRLHPLEAPERRVVARTTLCGIEVEADDRVVACLAAANRDPAVFTDPDRVVLGRPGGLLTFGAGPHRCPGAAVARDGLAAGVRILLESYPCLRAAEDLDEVEWIGAARPAGLKRLLVTSA